MFSIDGVYLYYFNTQIQRMPRIFTYQVFTIDISYTRYYAQFGINYVDDLPGTLYQWDFGDGSTASNERDALHEYLPGEYLVILSQSINGGVYTVIESAIAFIVAIPRSKLANNQLQPISTVELYPTTGLKQSVSLPVQMLELGDTYSQNKSDYVNEYEESWSITTGLLTEVQKDRLGATFEQLGGVHAFNFVPAMNSPAVSLICESWSVTQLSVNDYQLSIQAKRFWSRPRVSLVEPPFRGGQCLTQYYVYGEITATYRQLFSGNPDLTVVHQLNSEIKQRSFNGKINSITPGIYLANGSYLAGFRIASTDEFNNNYISMLYPDPPDRDRGNGTTATVNGFSSIRVRRVDGFSDDCGDILI